MRDCSSQQSCWPLAAIVASSEAAIASKTLAGIVTSRNAAAERLFGFTAQEMIGQSILKIIPAEPHPEEDRILAELRRGNPIERYETVRLRKDGDRVHISLTVSPIRDASGQILGAAMTGSYFRVTSHRDSNATPARVV